MSNSGLMSETLKKEIAQKLGVEDKVYREGWGAVSSRDCGKMVRTAIEIAENAMRTRS